MQESIKNSYTSVEEVVKDLEKNPVERGGNLYHPIPFPEFSHLKISSNEKQVRKKWEIIKKALCGLSPSGLSGLKVLDIGANAGFYTFSLTGEGAEVTAFEPHPRYGPVGEFLVREKKLPVEWHPFPFDPKMVEAKRYDTTLILSVFQWMADGGNRMEEALSELRAVSRVSRTLVFELGFNSGKSCIRTNKRNHYAELVRMLRENTDYTHFKLLGKTRLWRGNTRYLVICSNDEHLEDSRWRRLIRQIGL